MELEARRGTRGRHGPPAAALLDLAGRLGAETEVDLAGVIVNRVLPELFGNREEQLFRRLLEPEPGQVLRAEVGSAVRRVLEGAELAVQMRRARAVHIARLRDELPAATPMLYVPELFARARGIRSTHSLAEALGEEL